MKEVTTTLLLASLTLAGVAALAAPPTAEANGTVTDLDGNPIEGVVVVFSPVGNTALVYKGKTSKKGKYWISGMLRSTDDRWLISVESAEYVPSAMEAESRTVNRVILGGGVFRKALRPEEKIPEIVIPPMGTARVDFKMLTLEQVRLQDAEEMAEAQAAAAAVAEEQAEVRAQTDPWTEALSRAGAGDLEGSVEFFEKAIQQEPDDAQRRGGYATVLYQLERMDGAAEQAMKAVELDQTDIESRLVLYGVYVNTDRLAAAAATLDEAQAVAPENRKVLRQQAYLALERQDPAAAIGAHEALVEIDPDDTESWLALGDLYAARGDIEKSEGAYNRVIELDPANAHQIFFNIGALMMNKSGRSDNETQSAISAFRKAVEIKPDYAPAYQQLGFALLGVGDRAGARGSLESYVRLAPDAPDAAQMQAIITTLDQ